MHTPTNKLFRSQQPARQPKFILPMKMLTLSVAAAALIACQSTPNVDELEREKSALEDKLQTAQHQIAVLERRENELETRIEELERVSNVLALEKTSRVKESSQLRMQARHFIQQQIDDFKRFLVAGELLDYVGSELVPRSRLEEEPLTLVDVDHPVPRSGSITGVTGHFNAPTELHIKLLRPVKDKHVVIWESRSLTIDAAGEQTVQLPVSVGVEPGDVIAYVFPQAVTVSFDRGTGDTRFTRRELAMGDTVSASSLGGKREKRAYSLGVYAILE